MARLEGFEPTASAFAGLRSIQLSYKRFFVLLQPFKPERILYNPGFYLKSLLLEERYLREKKCRRRDLNPHVRKGHYALNVARLPFRHFGN